MSVDIRKKLEDVINNNSLKRFLPEKDFDASLKRLEGFYAKNSHLKGPHRSFFDNVLVTETAGGMKSTKDPTKGLVASTGLSHLYKGGSPEGFDLSVGVCQIQPTTAYVGLKYLVQHRDVMLQYFDDKTLTYVASKIDPRVVYYATDRRRGVLDAYRGEKIGNSVTLAGISTVLLRDDDTVNYVLGVASILAKASAYNLDVKGDGILACVLHHTPVSGRKLGIYLEQHALKGAKSDVADEVQAAIDSAKLEGLSTARMNERKRTIAGYAMMKKYQFKL